MDGNTIIQGEVVMKLKIELTLEGKTISGRVLEQDEDLRGVVAYVTTLIENEDFKICTRNTPQLTDEILFVRGECTNEDDELFEYTFNSTETAKDTYKDIVSLVNKLNGELGGVVDEWGRALFLNYNRNVVSNFLIRPCDTKTEQRKSYDHMKIYISGKITGNKDYIMTFANAEALLKEKFPGATVLNPAEVLLPNLCDWDDYMVICLRLLDKATHIYMLDNWVQSRGACTEHLHALENDIKVLWSDNSPYRGA